MLYKLRLLLFLICILHIIACQPQQKYHTKQSLENLKRQQTTDKEDLAQELFFISPLFTDVEDLRNNTDRLIQYYETIAYQLTPHKLNHNAQATLARKQQQNFLCIAEKLGESAQQILRSEHQHHITLLFQESMTTKELKASIRFFGSKTYIQYKILFDDFTTRQSQYRYNMFLSNFFNPKTSHDQALENMIHRNEEIQKNELAALLNEYHFLQILNEIAKNPIKKIDFSVFQEMPQKESFKNPKRQKQVHSFSENKRKNKFLKEIFILSHLDHNAQNTFHEFMHSAAGEKFYKLRIYALRQVLPVTLEAIRLQTVTSINVEKIRHKKNKNWTCALPQI